MFGRPGNNLKVGFVAMPNSGKSSLFNVLTSSDVLVAPYPFATINPAEARVAVPDAKLTRLAQIFGSQSVIPAYLTVMDIAGLVKGAAEGQGLGNAFLANIRAVDAIFHVVRVFEDPDVPHVEGTLDPVRDMVIIHEELRLKDLELLSGRIAQLEKQVKRGANGNQMMGKAWKTELDVLVRAHDWIGADKDVRNGEWSEADIEILNPLQLLTAKPMVYLANVSETEYASNSSKWLPKIEEWVRANNVNNETSRVLTYCGELEAAVAELNDGGKSTDGTEYLTSLGTKSALPEIILSGYKALDLMHFHTAGPQQARAWTIRRGTKAPQAAGVIHTDFEKSFIAAETYSFADLEQFGSEAAVKSAGKYQSRGKDYVVQENDIVLFKFNAANTSKKH
ncbi:GTP-binding protein YchF [Ramicandelaber brevisporus]|nr:GTP-binding protein YchF [Ramicandelaber brevisporus]